MRCSTLSQSFGSSAGQLIEVFRSGDRGGALSLLLLLRGLHGCDAFALVGGLFAEAKQFSDGPPRRDLRFAGTIAFTLAPHALGELVAEYTIVVCSLAA